VDDAALRAGVDSRLLVDEGMQHDWPLTRHGSMRASGRGNVGVNSLTLIVAPDPDSSIGTGEARLYGRPDGRAPRCKRVEEIRMGALESHLAADGLERLDQPSVVWSLADRDPSLLSALAPACGRALFDDLVGCLPLPATCGPFRTSRFLRMPGSMRSFSYLLPVEDGAHVVNYKGTEPLVGDYGKTVARSIEENDGYRLDRFALIEHKFPLAVLRVEAVAEAETALVLQQRHLATYGSIARLPVPLLVFELTDEVSQAAFTRFRSLLSHHAYQRMVGSTKGRLGVFAYYYPGIDVRANHIRGMLPQTFDARRSLLAASGIEEICERWVETLTRLMCLGFVPGTPIKAIASGNIVQMTNSMMNGGFVDVDSATPVSSLSDMHLHNALFFCVTRLASIVHDLVFVTQPTLPPIVDVWSQASGLQSAGRPGMWAVQCMLMRSFRRAIEREARPGAHVDPRIRDYFRTDLEFSEMLDRLRVLAQKEISPHSASSKTFTSAADSAFLKVLFEKEES
jgi:hypothetical protein